MTNEEIKKILDGAPEGAIYYQVNSYVDEMGLVWRDGRWVDFGWDGAGTPLSTLRETLELRQEVERLKVEAIKLLDAAICPCCDKSGAYYDNYGEVCQCQWCDEVKQLREQDHE